jgi:predicted nicotinamide N-methyase
MVFDDDDQEEDPFWQIALNEEYQYGSTGKLIDNDDDDSSSGASSSTIGEEEDDDDDDENNSQKNEHKQHHREGGLEEGRTRNSHQRCDNNRRTRRHRTSSRGKITKYQLPITNNNTDDDGRGGRRIVLELAPLPPMDGIWTPVGADAWYSSALLASMILQQPEQHPSPLKKKRDNEANAHYHDYEQPHDNDPSNTTKNSTEEWSILPSIPPTATSDDISSCNHPHLPPQQNRPFRVLELGSGAMGLSGLACAAALSLRPNAFPSWTVVLTDNDPDILHQLKINVKSNVSILTTTTTVSTTITTQSSNNDDGGVDAVEHTNATDTIYDGTIQTKKILVEALDWSNDNMSQQQHHDDNENENSDSVLSSQATIDLVIGSELVYTSETAHALVKILFRLLDDNPYIQIWIVQVIDRYGWSEIVLPTLLQAQSSHNNTKHKIHIQSIPISWTIHDMASSMIPMGGTLDRHAYGAFCITNTI